MDAELVSGRAAFVRSRLLEINKQAGDILLENGMLLRELATNHYYREDGFATFEDAIQHMHDVGQLDYGPRQARHMIAIVTMVEKLSLEPGVVKTLGVSKLREIAALRNDADQQRLLQAAPEMSVADVQSEAKRIRDKAAGRDVDPLVSVPFKITATQKTFLDDCLTEGRRVYGLETTVPDGDVLVDCLLADWYNNRDQIAAEVVEAAGYAA